MFDLPGYHKLKQIYRTEETTIFSALNKENKKVVIKFLTKTSPSHVDIARFMNEYNLAKKLDGAGTVAVYDFVIHENQFAIIEEDFGISLAKWLNRNELPVEKFLIMAISITEALEKIHAHNIVHKDINPNNILYDAKSETIKIIDFEIASILTSEHHDLKNNNVIEGMLSYISPEQTGRTNKGVDCRSDFYSLGMSFYEMLTGILPFVNEHVLELIYHHLATTPKPPHEINAKIPKILSDIVMKLVSKNPEDRYQSTHGILSDLHTCLQFYREEKKIPSFALGKEDFSKDFKLPEKIYGREQEISVLLKAIERSTERNAELFIVKGEPGIGKSAIVYEVQELIVQKHANFISGKFELLTRSLPYSAITQAFNQYILQVLTDKERTNSLRDKLLDSLEGNLIEIIMIIPNLALLIGEQRSLTGLPDIKAKNRLHYSFQKFIQTIADKNNPLIIFLDDLQWIDTASLNLLEDLLLQHDNRYFLVIGTYRDNEVNETHALSLTLGKFKKNNVPITSIKLNYLQLQHTEKYLMDTFRCGREKIEKLAVLSQKKTKGNPFFLGQFLTFLYKEGILEFSMTTGEWNWDPNAIEHAKIADNVVDFIIKGLKKLSIETQNILKYASIIGNQFDMNTLAFIMNQPVKKIAVFLQPALMEQIIFPMDESYKLIAEDSEGNACYQFSHDRIIQASYALIEENEKEKIHLEIARRYMEKYDEQKIDEKLHFITQQFNRSIHLIDSYEEKHKVATLNFRAAKKTFASGAYFATYELLKHSLYLTSDFDWDKENELLLDIYINAMLAAYLCSDAHEMLKLSEIALVHTKSLTRIAEIYEIRIKVHRLANHTELALQDLLYILKILGIPFPKKASFFQLLLSIIKTKITLFGKSVHDFERLPRIQNANIQLALHIIVQNISIALEAGQPLYVLLFAFKSITLTLQYGNSPSSVMIFINYAFLLYCVFHDYPSGNDFSNLALKFLNDPLNQEARHVALCIYAITNEIWQHSVRQTLKTLSDSVEYALEFGDHDIACISGMGYIYNAIYCGIELESIEEDLQKYINLSRKFDHKIVLVNNLAQQQFIYNLRIKETTNTVFSGEFFDEVLDIETEIKNKNSLFLFSFSFIKLMLCCILGDFNEALKMIHFSQKFKEAEGTLFSYGIYFYMSLCYLGLSKEAPAPLKKQYFRIIKKNQKKLKRYANIVQSNYKHKYLLIEAELAKENKAFIKAEDLYNEAIALADKNGYVHEKGIACELAFNFYLTRKNKFIAKIYFQECYLAYQRWGATAKLKILEQSNPEFLTLLTKKTTLKQTISATGGLSTEPLDLMSILKASNAISNEMDLSILLKNIMQISAENAGAKNGMLLLEDHGNWISKAQIDMYETEPAISLETRSLTPELIPLTLINRVIHTKKPIVLDDALREELHGADPYILAHQSKSVLALPLLYQGELTAILYFENNLLSGAFSENRLAVLNLLSSQMVSSIYNVRLYTYTLDLNKSYERFIPSQFLNLLGKKSIMDVKLGDQVQKELSILFCDIRNFTSISEKLSPRDNFRFINLFLKFMEPSISKYYGFIDKYVGDAIMALFFRPESHAVDAIHCAIDMFKTLKRFNNRRSRKHEEPLRMGVGINTGQLILGTVGGAYRMDCSVISDAVNVASRVESLTKVLDAPLLISQDTLNKAENFEAFGVRKAGIESVKGKSERLTVYEIFDIDSEEIYELKLNTRSIFENAIDLFEQKKFGEAAFIFKKIIAENPDDNLAQRYLNKIQEENLKG